MEPYVIQFKTHADARGILSVCESEQDIPFEIKRVFWIVDPKGKRGGHSHKACQQVIFPISGIFRIRCGEIDTVIQSPFFGVYVPVDVEVTLDSFSADAVVMVLCSEHYDAEDLVPAL